MKVAQLAVGGFDNNFSYFVTSKDETTFAIVDPAGRIDDFVKKERGDGKELSLILITHSHFDHIEQLPHLLARHKIPVYAHPNARDRIQIPDELFRSVSDGGKIALGTENISVLHTPGHIDDAVCFYLEKENAHDGTPKLITGDTLFVEGCGRADLEHSSVTDLYRSLHLLKQLPPETEVYSGHDYGSKPVSTIAWELEHNKYFLAKDAASFRSIRLSSHPKV